MWEVFKKNEGTDLKVWEVGKIIGQKWRELADEEKQVCHTSTCTHIHVHTLYIYI